MTSVPRRGREDGGLRPALQEALGCEFNHYNECQTHPTEPNGRGYDEPTCGTVSTVLALPEVAELRGQVERLAGVVEGVATNLAVQAAQEVAYGNHAHARKFRRFALTLTRALPALASSSATATSGEGERL